MRASATNSFWKAGAASEPRLQPQGRLEQAELHQHDGGEKKNPGWLHERGQTSFVTQRGESFAGRSQLRQMDGPPLSSCSRRTRR